MSNGIIWKISPIVIEPLFSVLLNPPLFKIQKSGLKLFSGKFFLKYNIAKSDIKFPKSPSGHPTSLVIEQWLIILSISFEIESLYFESSISLNSSSFRLLSISKLEELVSTIL